MGILTQAVIEQTAAKVGLLGRQGSGKTTTAMLILIGLSKTFHKNAPVAFWTPRTAATTWCRSSRPRA
jgi:ABC-type dipeptide/oligopeptide/nickel transport system ATPase subunit